MDDLVRECKPDLRALLRPHGTQETAYPAAGNETRIFPKVTHRRMRLSACHSVQVGAQDATQNSVGPTQPCTRWIRRSLSHIDWGSSSEERLRRTPASWKSQG